MKYVSTRGEAEILDFEGVTLAGLARDGGLYVPESIPSLDAETIRAMAGKPYADVAFTVIKPFVGDTIPDADLRAMLKDTYGGAVFRHDAVAPLVQLGANEWVLELFHGPTLAFKDFALQLLGRFFDYFTAKRGQKLTILGATSGDTGSAAIEACRGRENVTIYMLHPKGRVSEVQRRQMTTVLEPNVVNIAVDGTFDDCQALVKASFNDLKFRDEVGLTAVNSINWARVMAQIVYYFTSASAFGAPDRSVSYSVPTGNFGDIYAGFIAREMGMPIDKLVIATNSNDILARTLQTGSYSKGDVHATLSPSMDIQVSSNFERMMFDLSGRNGSAIKTYMADFADTGKITLSDAEISKARAVFEAKQVDDKTTSEVMAHLQQATGYVTDPHTAVGIEASKLLNADAAPRVTLSTAHPVKFGEAVQSATGISPELPSHMADLYDREEGYAELANDITALQTLILKGVGQ
ncbi:MAG: threonine synthase [Kordiimonadaceae bacterium]|nr:threonine synthase [Kordiimonadaceae bacterium]MBO6567197.1 threonine synthase [Kordiimonadaceae bacterium]MBO6963588.1 threonine synthase [Kordiimonadaceae bacterium]